MVSPFGTVEKGREVTNFYIGLQQLLLPPSRQYQLPKLMATKWHLMTDYAALSLRIFTNTTNEYSHKLSCLIFGLTTHS